MGAHLQQMTRVWWSLLKLPIARTLTSHMKDHRKCYPKVSLTLKLPRVFLHLKLMLKPVDREYGTRKSQFIKFKTQTNIRKIKIKSNKVEPQKGTISRKRNLPTRISQEKEKRFKWDPEETLWPTKKTTSVLEFRWQKESTACQTKMFWFQMTLSSEAADRARWHHKNMELEIMLWAITQLMLTQIIMQCHSMICHTETITGIHPGRTPIWILPTCTWVFLTKDCNHSWDRISVINRRCSQIIIMGWWTMSNLQI